jgi:hypothetical protein
MDKVRSELEVIKTAQSETTTKHTATDQRLDTLSQEVANKHTVTDQKLDTLSQEVTNKHTTIEQKIDTLSQEVTNKHTTIEQKLDTLSQEVTETKTATVQLKGDLDDSVKTITKSVDDKIDPLFQSLQTIDQRFTTIQQDIRTSVGADLTNAINTIKQDITTDVTKNVVEGLLDSLKVHISSAITNAVGRLPASQPAASQAGPAGQQTSTSQAGPTGRQTSRTTDNASEHGDSEHGESEHGESEHGESEHGESEHGESEDSSQDVAVRMYTLTPNHSIDFGGEKLWFLGSPYKSVPATVVSQGTIDLVRKNERTIVDFAQICKSEQTHDTACMLVKKDRKGMEFEGSAKLSYFACDRCLKRNEPCIRVAVGGYTTRGQRRTKRKSKLTRTDDDFVR